MANRRQTDERLWQSAERCAAYATGAAREGPARPRAWGTIPNAMTRLLKTATDKVRIKDVARRARVSVGTVSHVLSGRAHIPPAD